MPYGCLRGQEGHLRGEEATVEGVDPGEDSPNRDSTAR